MPPPAVDRSSPRALLVMGVAGCGKSTLGRLLADAWGWAFVDADDHHEASARDRMSQGLPLTDGLRAAWLERLAQQLQRHPEGVVLACSALKRAYRERLRAAAPDLAIVHLQVGREAALQRVAARAGQHFFPPSLVDSQFETLEPPQAEARTITLDGTLPPERLQRQAESWASNSAIIRW